MIKVRSDHR